MYLNARVIIIQNICKIINKRYKISDILLPEFIIELLALRSLPLYYDSLSLSISLSLYLLSFTLPVCVFPFSLAPLVYFFLLSSARTYVTAGCLIEISNIVTRRRRS